MGYEEGLSVGFCEGTSEGCEEGSILGCIDGWPLGCLEGRLSGCFDGWPVGLPVCGLFVLRRCGVGTKVGYPDGMLEGK